MKAGGPTASAPRPLTTTSYNYKRSAKYGGLGAFDGRRRKELEQGNRWLKRLYADRFLEKVGLKDVIAKQR